jgi:glutamate-ammonia-ligase adenylyltransferase
MSSERVPMAENVKIQDLTPFLRDCPEVDPGFVRAHVSRLPEAYFKRFAGPELVRHLRILYRLSPDRPVEADVRTARDGTVQVTVFAFDTMAVFSIITGILSGMGFDIVSGEVYTYRREEETPEGGRFGRRRIVDHFAGTVDTRRPFRAWKEELLGRLESVIRLLERGGERDLREARRRVSEMVVQRLSRIHRDLPPPLPPVQVSLDRVEEGTRLRIVSEDTPAFLHALSQALSLHQVSIEQVKIRTISNRVEDLLVLVDGAGHPIEDAETLDRIRLSVLLTKQFVYVLPDAPDPLTALERFSSLLDDILRLPGPEGWLEMLADPHALRGLARLLGASDFLWEDFIRGQYETLLPMLRPALGKHRFSEPGETLEQRLEASLRAAGDLEEARERLNAFKDGEIFRIDLDHIVNPEVDFRGLARRLTRLAEAVIRAAVRLARDELVRRFGPPLSVAGIESPFAVLGLGKLGGAALGYASDIEILCVYEDSGKTGGERSISNADFFARLVKEVMRLIEAKREGIFHVDARLRPYGTAGPMACSLETFCRYYAPGGGAHAAERLALVRMRAVAGDAALGARLERLRDEMVYDPRTIDLESLQELRERQFRDKAGRGGPNAKFSPGGLVDLEYGIQILQVAWGRVNTRLATPLLHEAVDGLAEAGALSEEEARGVQSAYDFLRRLINGLRMLRGSARDLVLPEPDADEYGHLARRMGYRPGGALSPSRQLQLDFETHTAVVRAFVERHFGRDALPGPAVGTPADLVLSEGLSPELRDRILACAGFRNPERALVNVQALADMAHARETFARLAVLAFDMLCRGPDPDMALNNWERYLHSLSSPEMHYQVSLSQPMRLEILLGLLAGSQFLADTLVRYPGFLDWVLIPEILHGTRRRKDVEEELRQGEPGGRTAWMNRLRRLRRRELLRIGTRDICLNVPVDEVMGELSAVAEACVQTALECAWQHSVDGGRAHDGLEPEGFCILAMGKLGGGELNYSSDIDLLAVCEPAGAGGKETAARVMEGVRADLMNHTEEGHAYRVDLRLRPFGRSGDLVPTVQGLLDYYRGGASLWEIQAAIKMRPVAGNLLLGHRVAEAVHEVLLAPRSPEEIVRSIKALRAEAKRIHAGPAGGLDIKNGAGGIRDVEFLVQALQLIHAPDAPHLLEGNTLRAVGALEERRVISRDQAETLREDYRFLRRVEHALQLLEDRQTHVVPADPDALGALAGRVSRGGREAAGVFREELEGCLARVRGNAEAMLRLL